MYIGNSPTTAAFTTDYFNGDGSTVAYTMSVAPASTSSIIVTISGVVQSPNTYSINAMVITFSAAPPTGIGNISIRYLGLPAVTPAIANSFPFFKSTGVQDDIPLISNQYFPFYLASGASSNIPLIVA